MAQFGYIQIIRQCNQQCLFCSSPDNGLILDYRKIIKDIDDYIKECCNGIILTGGEPTLHPDLPKIIAYGAEKNKEVRIITNGQKTAVPAYLGKLKKQGLSLMHVSLHSVSSKKQNYLSQNKDSLKNIIKTLINARKLDLPVNINTVINFYNAKTLDKNIDFLLKNFPEINHYVFNNLDPENNRASVNKFLIPKLKDFKKSLFLALEKLVKANKTFRVEMVPLCYMGEFAAFSTETRKIVKKEKRILKFLDERQKPFLIQNNDNSRYDYDDKCNDCNWRSICAGVHGLNQYYFADELEPQKTDSKDIINKILND